jgi:Mn2+/Fe2+ NRAMP family transporter
MAERRRAAETRAQAHEDAPAGAPGHGKAARLVGELGPGLITGGADDDPSGIATYSQGGAQAGMALLWTLVLTYPLMSAVQLVSAEIGRVTGHGLARNMRRVFSTEIVMGLVGLLFVANTINIGADLAAMGSSAALVVGLSPHALTLGFAAISLLLQLFVPYHRYAHLLKWMTLSLLAYVALLFTIRLDWREVGLGLIIPRIGGRQDVVTIVAIFGTTISPYLFFWQSAQEVEEIADHKGSRPLRFDGRSAATRELGRIRFDTWTGMAFSNLVALAIMIGTAATLHASGHTSIDTAADAARALQPVAGRFSSLLFSLGVIGTGMLAVPVLAGSTAYAVAELRGWRSSLASRLRDARGFYAIIICATLFGIAIDWSSIDPVKALFWSAVLNGVVAVPLLVAMMLIVSNRAVMGRYRAGPRLLTLGWACTAVMGAAAIGLFIP